MLWSAKLVSRFRRKRLHQESWALKCQKRKIKISHNATKGNEPFLTHCLFLYIRCNWLTILSVLRIASSTCLFALLIRSWTTQSPVLCTVQIFFCCLKTVQSPTPSFNCFSFFFFNIISHSFSPPDPLWVWRHQCYNATDNQQWKSNRSEERRVGKECRSRWSPYH